MGQTTYDIFFDAIEKIRNGGRGGFKPTNPAAAAQMSQDNLNNDTMGMDFLNIPKPKEKPDGNEVLQLIFPVEKYFVVGSPLGLFAAVYNEESFIRSKLPTCQEFFNCFHPSDLIANRLEPLIKRYEYPDGHCTGHF